MSESEHNKRKEDQNKQLVSDNVLDHCQKKERGRKKWRWEIGISLLALLLSTISIGFDLLYTLWLGQAQPLPLSGYTIIRGVDHFPSDHLVFPMEWENTGGKVVVVRHPYIILRELDSSGEPTTREHRFSLAGEYSEISSQAFNEGHSIKRSFTLQPHSISLKTLLFHVEEWWNEKGSTYSFRFPPDKTYQMKIGFQRNSENKTELQFGKLITYSGAGTMEKRGEESRYWWDFWDMRK